MNSSFLISVVTLCLAAQCALAQYNQQQAAYGGGAGHVQRKMAPTPQTYSQPQQQHQYQPQQQQYQPQQPQQQYQAPQEQTSYESSNNYGAAAGNDYGSNRAASSYEERQQPMVASSSYQSKPAASPSSYGRQAAAGYGAPAAYAKAAPKYEEPYHPPMPFAWGYDINDGYGGAQYHKESGDEYGKRTGSYGYTDAYGVYRQVDYVADEHGFRATIKTNEPGTANESPADVELHAYEPPSNYYAGNTNSYSSGGYNSAPSAATSSYAAPASPAKSSYGAQQRASYGAAAPAKYGKQQQQSSGYGKQQQQQSSYGASGDYSSSSPMPVYQQAAKVAAVVPVQQQYAKAPMRAGRY